MQYTIHGKNIEYYGQECGIYKQAPDHLGQDYAIMDIAELIKRINVLPKDNAIKALTVIDALALEQTKWTQTPQNLGYPILIGGPKRTPIEKAKPGIQNTYDLTQMMLNVLNEN